MDVLVEIDGERNQLKIGDKVRKQKIEHLERELKKHVTKCSKLEASLATLATSSKRDLEAKDQSIAALLGDLEAKDQSVAALQGDLEAKDQSIAVVGGDLEAKDQSILALQGDLEAKDQSIAALKGELEKRHVQLEDLEGRKRRNEDKFKSFCDELFPSVGPGAYGVLVDLE